MEDTTTARTIRFIKAQALRDAAGDFAKEAQALRETYKHTQMSITTLDSALDKVCQALYERAEDLEK